MKTTLKSSIFKNHTLIKTYSEGFEYPDFLDKNEELNLNGVKGFSREIHLGGIHLELRDVETPGNYTINVSHDFPLFKLHFEIEGNNLYTPKNKKSKRVYIPKGHYNLFYFPEVKGVLSYATKRRKTLELKFTEAYIKKVIGENFQHSLIKLGNAIKNQTPCVMWKESQPISPQLHELINEITACQYTGNIRKAYLEAKVMELLVVLLAKTEEEEEVFSIEDLGHRKVLAAEAFIKQNLGRSLTISQLASEVGMNTSHLKQNFKKVFNNTIFKHITHLRMSRAKELLKEGKLTIAEISTEVGYKNPQHFTVAFKKVYKVLPSKYLSRRF